MKEILRITVGLTVSCLLAGAVMGGMFVMTAKAKKRNERLRVQETMLSLLGYNQATPPPSGLKFYDIYRYVIEDGDKRQTGYVLRLRKGGDVAYALLVMDLQGNFGGLLGLHISPEEAKEADARENAMKAVLTPPKAFTYADTTIIAKIGEKRMAYLLPGEFPGYKTFIRVILALDPGFEIIGLEIMEHEEDPGLGAEIEEGYFKDQFKDKTYEKVRVLKVVKEPLPEEYKRYLEATAGVKEGRFSKEDINRIRNKYQDKDIYALTGATISSEAVTEGVQNMTKKFAYRIRALDDLVASRGLLAAF
jgi:electron transport complex protein RnfG